MAADRLDLKDSAQVAARGDAAVDEALSGDRWGFLYVLVFFPIRYVF